MLVWLALTLAANPVAAQTTTTYSNTTAGTINAATTCTAPLVRNFTVGASYIVGGVDLGLLATHSWRGDLRVTLQSPAGTRVQLVNGDTGSIDGNNLNARLDDDAAQTVNSDGTGTNHSVSAPPYQNSFRPNSPLSAFNGENSAGTWRLEICDQYPSADNGNFVRADLYLTSLPANYADLSLTKSVSNAAPAFGASINYVLSVTNASGSALTATGVTVADNLPAGFNFTGASGFGSYNSSAGVWTVGSIPAGVTRTLTISGTVAATAGASVTNSAEISASSAFDFDSTPGNGAAGEDDQDSATFTVSGTRVAGTPPTLVCPVGTTAAPEGAGVDGRIRECGFIRKDETERARVGKLFPALRPSLARGARPRHPVERQRLLELDAAQPIVLPCDPHLGGEVEPFEPGFGERIAGRQLEPGAGLRKIDHRGELRSPRRGQAGAYVEAKPRGLPLAGPPR